MNPLKSKNTIKFVRGQEIKSLIYESHFCFFFSGIYDSRSFYQGTITLLRLRINDLINLKVYVLFVRASRNCSLGERLEKQNDYTFSYFFVFQKQRTRKVW